MQHPPTPPPLLLMGGNLHVRDRRAPRRPSGCTAEDQSCYWCYKMPPYHVSCIGLWVFLKVPAYKVVPMQQPQDASFLWHVAVTQCRTLRTNSVVWWWGTRFSQTPTASWNE